MACTGWRIIDILTSSRANRFPSMMYNRIPRIFHDVEDISFRPAGSHSSWTASPHPNVGDDRLVEPGESARVYSRFSGGFGRSSRSLTCSKRFYWPGSRGKIL